MIMAIRGTVGRCAWVRTLLLAAALMLVVQGTVQQTKAADPSGAGTANVLVCESAGGEAHVVTHRYPDGTLIVVVTCKGGYLNGWVCGHWNSQDWNCVTTIVVPDEGGTLDGGDLAPPADIRDRDIGVVEEVAPGPFLAGSGVHLVDDAVGTEDEAMADLDGAADETETVAAFVPTGPRTRDQILVGCEHSGGTYSETADGTITCTFPGGIIVPIGQPILGQAPEPVVPPAEELKAEQVVQPVAPGEETVGEDVTMLVGEPLEAVAEDGVEPVTELGDTEAAAPVETPVDTSGEEAVAEPGASEASEATASLGEPVAAEGAETVEEQP